VSLRNDLFTSKAQVQRASNAAKDLLDQPRQDLQPQVRRLQDEVATLNQTRQEARAEGQAFSEESAEYFAKWDETLKGMSQQTASGGERRMEMAQRSVDRLRGQAGAVRQELNPFMASLNEASKYLSTDTTRGGLKVVEPQLRNAINREKRIISEIDKLVKIIDEVRAGK
jgi:hypothetical protein